MKDSKRNFILFILIITSLVFFSYIEVYRIYGGKNSNLYKERYENICNDNDIIVDNNLCELNISKYPWNPDYLTIFYSIIRSDILYHLPMFSLILILFFSLSNINKLFKSKYLYYYVERKNYKSFIKHIIISSYKYCVAVPIMIILISLLSLTISNHGSNELSIAMSTATFDIIHYETKGFLILYMINIILKWLTFINVGLIILSRNRKFIFTILETHIIYFLLEIIFENYPQYFWIFDFYNPENYSIYIYIFVSIIYFCVSFLCMLLTYKDKENLLKRVGEYL